jgi:hypothetical protein
MHAHMWGIFGKSTLVEDICKLAYRYINDRVEQAHIIDMWMSNICGLSANYPATSPDDHIDLCQIPKPKGCYVPPPPSHSSVRLCDVKDMKKTELIFVIIDSGMVAAGTACNSRRVGPKMYRMSVLQMKLLVHNLKVGRNHILHKVYHNLHKHQQFLKSPTTMKNKLYINPEQKPGIHPPRKQPVPHNIPTTAELKGPGADFSVGSKEQHIRPTKGS